MLVFIELNGFMLLEINVFIMDYNGFLLLETSVFILDLWIYYYIIRN